MSARRAELTRAAARLFAKQGYHGTSIGDLAEALGLQKGSLYTHIDSKADLLTYGNAERAIIEIAHRLARRERVAEDVGAEPDIES